MVTALVLTVGTTADPLVKAIEEQLQQESNLVVFLLYGRPFLGQEPSPFDVANRVKERAAELGVRVEPREVADPEDVDVCLQAVRAVLSEPEASAADRLVVDFTGGTKPMSAAVVHAALTEPVAGQLVLEYTGGQLRDKAGRVLREAMRLRKSERTATEETIREVLDLVRRFAYQEARSVVRRLPEIGRAEFVRKAVEALYAWDEFDYETSLQILRRYHQVARTLQDKDELAPLAQLLLRLLEPANRFVEALRRLRKLQTCQGKEWPRTDDMALFTVDVLENASRRLEEGRPTDSVLRAYRAVETAVHTRLLAHQINPWHPDWASLDSVQRADYERALEGRPLPQDLALTTGLRLVEVLEGQLPQDLAKKLQDLQLSRNRSYLEHGYLRLGEEDARRLLGYSAQLCVHLLRTDIAHLSAQVTHRV